MANGNGEPVDDQAEGRGGNARRGKALRIVKFTPEKGRARNLVIPDELYDRLCIYALKTKIKVQEGKKDYVRSLTVSEAACKALASFLPKLSITEEQPNANS
jgi:hypothetical protein